MLANIRTILIDLGWPIGAQFYLLVTIITLTGIIIIEPNPIFYRSINRMLGTGILLGILKTVGTTATLLALLLLPYERLRLVIISMLVLCGGITLGREWIRRILVGDKSPSSYVGGLFVAVQTASFLLFVSSGIALIIEAVLAPARILESDIALIGAVRGWIEVLATILVLVTIYYVGFIIVRRILRASGFSWVDPPNWRTLLPHLKYTIGPHLGWPPWQESTLADTVRQVYTKQIIGSERLDELIQAARIQPIEHPEQGFTFAIIGDPGEGDRSQLHPIIEEPNISQAMRASDGPWDPPGFVLICSDIVYPAGELMDYERTVYRPYTSPLEQGHPLWYGLPGNHDWYNNLKGMMLNFGYPAAHTTLQSEPYHQWKKGMRRGPWARYGFISSRIRWSEVAFLRKAYHLPTLGGDPLRPETHQRLPFWEIYCGEAPLTVIGLDTGSVGSIDELQRRWLIDRLRAAKARNNIIMILLSEPLYVNGEFAGGNHLRDLYAMIHKFNVHVIIGGDTHTYQHYIVKNCNQNHITHHFVNGGGGAYLAPPIDLKWDEDLPLRPDELIWMYKDPAHHIHDQIHLIDFYPTANQLRNKFSPPPQERSQSRLIQRIAGLEAYFLRKGFTTALDHDRQPLFQSFVTCSMINKPQGWTLRITPWFTSGEHSQLQPQEPIDITAPVQTKPSDTVLYSTE